MTRYVQIFVLCLTALIQLGAPLVHAHAPGDSYDSHLHMPGLEFMERLREEGLHAPDAEPESPLVVDMQGGILESARSLRPSPSCTPSIDANVCRTEPETHRFDLAKTPLPAPFNTLAYLSPLTSPPQARAPPR
ncbi:MAG: hypothetical protein PHT19_09580 [Methylococcus sp.]|nr:hypothetical protein [Methylococcus sp.]